jgi:hypothetical protein
MNFVYRGPSERTSVRFLLHTNAGAETKTMSANVAGHLDDLRKRIGSTSPTRLARIAFCVAESGVLEADRVVLEGRFRREGRRELATDVRNAPPERACVLLDGDTGETHCIYLNPAWAVE